MMRTEVSVIASAHGTVYNNAEQVPDLTGSNV